MASLDEPCSVLELESFVASLAGQQLLRDVFATLKDVERMANFCRGRGLGHDFFKAATGVTAVAGGVIVIAGGAILSGGAAVPAEFAALATALMGGGAITLAVGTGVQLCNNLVKAGWDVVSAKLASDRIVALPETMKQWDTKFNALLEAGGQSVRDRLGNVVCNSILLPQGICNVVQSANMAKDAHLMKGVLQGFLDAGVDAGAAIQEAGGLAAPQAVFGLAKAGGGAARGIFFSLSGVGIAFGLIDIIFGLGSMFSGSNPGSMFSGSNDAADALDASADKLCALLRIMLVYGRGTAAEREISHQLPKLLVVSVKATRIPGVSWRPGDLIASATRRTFGLSECTHDVYFSVAMQSRVRKTEVMERMSKTKRRIQLDTPQVVMMRILDRDADFTIQACAERGAGHRMTLGDSSLSSSFTTPLPMPSSEPEWRSSHCNCKITFTTQVLE